MKNSIEQMTKAQVLSYIKENNKDISILPILVIKWNEYILSKDSFVRNVLSFSEGNSLVVRSSCHDEDLSNYSNAGKYESVLNVAPNLSDIEGAIDKVFDSYEKQDSEEVLIQPMLSNVKLSGVVFTRDINTLANYYVVNYHEGTDTTVVTGGSKKNIHSYVHYKCEGNVPKDRNILALLDTCKKVEDYLCTDALDIEFAITKTGEVFILQVRPIARRIGTINDDIDFSAALNRIYKKVIKLSRKHPFLLGNTTCFGVMPDWNPAEILGVRPKKLAISLYKELITDYVWAKQRADYGYRDLTMHPLMISFCGIPYIDTRITFNSFIPRDLNNNIAEKLVCHYLDRLSNYPKYHDKIEFEIVYSCYYFGIHKKLKELVTQGFNENEIQRIEFSLLNLTNNIINPTTGLYINDLKKIEVLEKNMGRIEKSDISLVDRIYWLMEECKEYGTLPFAGIARAAFVAIQFLKSFVEVGIITNDDYDSYMNSLDTINRKMNCDLQSYQNGYMTKEEFLKKYGHIRPGTYDILSRRYDEAFDDYFSSGNSANPIKAAAEFQFSGSQKEHIQRELDENGLLISVDDLLIFIKKSIEGREYLKFIFTKIVSRILQLIEELGQRFDINKNDMAHIDISMIKQLYVDLFSGDVGELLRENIEHNKEQYKVALCIKLPSIITTPNDIYGYYQLDNEPNFITQKCIRGDVKILDGMNAHDLEGKIVFIQSADPGYDYIFSKNIKGLVTQFGGVNSHMAIRCAELGIPAVIGVGGSRFWEWSLYERIEIDCQMKKVVRIE